MVTKAAVSAQDGRGSSRRSMLRFGKTMLQGSFALRREVFGPSAALMICATFGSFDLTNDI